MRRPHVPRRRPAWIVALGTIAALAVAILVLWVVPIWLTRHPAGSLTQAEQLKAENDVRTPMIALLVAFGAAGTLLFTARTYRLNREGHVTDRYSKAVGQLGDASSPVRIGGVYALERIGVDSPKDRITIIYVLGAFIRERSKVLRERQDEPPEDVKAAIRVTGRLLPTTPDVVLDVRGAEIGRIGKSVPTCLPIRRLVELARAQQSPGPQLSAS